MDDELKPKSKLEKAGARMEKAGAEMRAEARDQLQNLKALGGGTSSKLRDTAPAAAGREGRRRGRGSCPRTARRCR